jgi:CYTH domain-containing protein
VPPPSREIERKFLVTDAPPDLDRHPSQEIRQGYVAIDATAEVRVRQRGERRTLTVKSAPARTRVEEEIDIDEARLDSLWELTAGRRVVKTRYLIDHGGATVELDVYHDALSGLMTAEIEFESEAASDAFRPPPWLGREVTGDPRYANQALATQGPPPATG